MKIHIRATTKWIVDSVRCADPRLTQGILTWQESTVYIPLSSTEWFSWPPFVPPFGPVSSHDGQIFLALLELNHLSKSTYPMCKSQCPF
jgi:hypothetical protein